MKTLNEEIESRLAEVLPDCDQSTSVGFLQWNACLNTLERGNLLVVRRRPGGFPETQSIQRVAKD
jgi:hypothetical protein